MRGWFRWSDVWTDGLPVLGIVTVGWEPEESAKLTRWGADVFAVEEGTSLAHLAHRLGLFESVGEAKRNGWTGPIVSGLRKVRAGVYNGDLPTKAPGKHNKRQGWLLCAADGELDLSLEVC